MQAVLADEVGAHPGEIAFVGAGEALVQQARDGQAQDGIAEELETLVVVGAEAAVRQRRASRRASAKAVAEAVLQGVEAGSAMVIDAGSAVHCFELPSYLISR